MEGIFLVSLNKTHTFTYTLIKHERCIYETDFFTIRAYPLHLHYMKVLPVDFVCSM